MEQLLEQVPKYVKIRETLRRQIIDGAWLVNEQIPTEPELMKLHGVSRPTAANAIKDLVKEGLLVRASGKGTFVKSTHPALTEKEIVGLVVPTTGHLFEGFSGNLIRGLMEHHLFPLVVDLSRDYETGFRRTKILIDKQPPFLILSPFIGEIPFDYLERYQGHIIFIYRIDAAEKHPGSYVLSDVKKGAAMAAEHLLCAGYRKIIFYSILPAGGSKPASYLQVEEGIRAVLKKHGLPDETFSCWIAEDEPATLREEGSLEKRLKREQSPLALIADSDYRLKPAYKAAGKLGLRIPEDIGLVGWSNTPWCETFRPHLTSIATREDLLAKKVIEVITNKDMQGKKIFISPELVIRDSTRRCK